MHTFFIYRRGFQGHVKVGLIRLRFSSGPDLQSPGGADSRTDGAEDALAFPFFDEVFVYQSSGYCATGRLPARFWDRLQRCTAAYANLNQP